MKHRSFYFTPILIALAILLVLPQKAAAQIPEERAKPVLENGVPAIKLMENNTGKYLGWESKAYLDVFEGEPAIRFAMVNVIVSSNSPIYFSNGDFYITKTRLIYSPKIAYKTGKGIGFNIKRDELSSFKLLQKDINAGNLFGLTKYCPYCIELKSKSVKNGQAFHLVVSIIKPGGAETGYKYGDSYMINVVVAAYNNFDSILQQFRQLTAGLLPAPSLNSTQANSSTTNPSSNPSPVQGTNKQALYERFVNNRMTNPDVAYNAAKAYLQAFPDDKSEEAELMKRWIAAYEKVKGIK